MIKIMRKILLAIICFLTYEVVTPFVVVMFLLELIMAIIYLSRYVVSMTGLAFLYAMGYIFPSILATLPRGDKSMLWVMYRIVVRVNFQECLNDIRNMSTFTK